MEVSKAQAELLMVEGLLKDIDQYKQERDELSNKLDKECNDNYKLEGQLHDMSKQRDLLREDITLLKENQKTREEVIEKLREELRMHIQCNGELGRVNKLKEQAINELQFENDALRLQADEYFEFWQAELEQRQKLSDRWSKLADYIKERREVNPASIQYIKIEGIIHEMKDE